MSLKAEEKAKQYSIRSLQEQLKSAKPENVQADFRNLTCSLFVLSTKYGAWALGRERIELFEEKQFLINLNALLCRAISILCSKHAWATICTSILVEALANKPISRSTMQKRLCALKNEGGPSGMFHALLDFVLLAYDRLRVSAKQLRQRIFAHVETKVRTNRPTTTTTKFKRPKVRVYTPTRKSWREQRPKPIKTNLPVRMPEIAHRVLVVDKIRKRRYGWNV